MGNKQTGSAIHLILVAVALFGALSYAFTNSTRTSISFIDSAEREANATGALSRSNDVLAGLKRLKLRGCKDSEISYEGPPFNASTGSYNSSSPKDYSCHLYHIKGASIMYLDGSPGCVNIGDVCPDGTVFAGMTPDGGIPMFTTPSDAPGTYGWSSGFPYLDITTLANCATGGEAACSTGEANTHSLVSQGQSPSPAPYQAANYCSGLNRHGRDDWYLPAINELIVMHSSLTKIGGFTTTGGFPASAYWSSSERGHNLASSLRFEDGEEHHPGKENKLRIRCVRK